MSIVSAEKSSSEGEEDDYIGDNLEIDVKRKVTVIAFKTTDMSSKK